MPDDLASLVLLVRLQHHLLKLGSHEVDISLTQVLGGSTNQLTLGIVPQYHEISEAPLLCRQELL